MITAEQIFTGATFANDEDLFTIESVTSKEVYGRGDKFDSSAPSKDEMVAKLNKWGYHYVGVEKF